MKVLYLFLILFKQRIIFEIKIKLRKKNAQTVIKFILNLHLKNILILPRKSSKSQEIFFQDLRHTFE